MRMDIATRALRWAQLSEEFLALAGANLAGLPPGRQRQPTQLSARLSCIGMALETGLKSLLICGEEIEDEKAVVKMSHGLQGLCHRVRRLRPDYRVSRVVAGTVYLLDPHYPSWLRYGTWNPGVIRRLPSMPAALEATEEVARLAKRMANRAVARASGEPASRDLKSR